VIAPGVERIGFIKVGYADYKQSVASLNDVFYSAGIYSPPGAVALNDLSDVVLTAPATGDLLQKSATNWVNVTVADTIADTLRQVNGFRLSTSLVTSIMPESGSVSTLYLTPYTSPHIALWDGTKYVLKTVTFASLALAGLTANLPYDVFAYLSGGAVTLELLAWTNATTRAVGVGWTGGVMTKATDVTRRYLGTIVPDAATTIGFSASRKPIWNFYNRVLIRAHIAVSGLSYAIPDTAGVFRQVNADTANKLELAIGLAHEVVHITGDTTMLPNNNAGAGDAVGILGMGFESTTVNGAHRSNLIQVLAGTTIASIGFHAHTEYVGTIAEGYRVINWLEYCDLNGGGTLSFFGGAAPATPCGIAAITLM
jgi:hypothetical protein